MGSDKRLRVSLAADYQQLEFLRVLRSHALDPITDAGALIAPHLVAETRVVRAAGVALTVATGLLLFAAGGLVGFPEIVIWAYNGQPVDASRTTPCTW